MLLSYRFYIDSNKSQSSSDIAIINRKNVHQLILVIFFQPGIFSIFFFSQQIKQSGGMSSSLFSVIFALLFSSLIIESSADESCKLYGADRVITSFRSTQFGTSGIPSVNVATYLDKNHTRAGQTPYYASRPGYLKQKEQVCLDYFRDTFGLNFRAGFWNPFTGFYQLANAIMVPVNVPVDLSARVNSDTVSGQRAGQWSAGEAGWVVSVFVGGGNYSGLKTGSRIIAGDGMYCNEYIFVEVGRDWSDVRYREFVEIYSLFPVRQSLNNEGLADTPQQIEAYVLNEATGQKTKGRVASQTTRNRNPDGTFTLRQQAAMIFGEASYYPPAPASVPAPARKRTEGDVDLTAIPYERFL